MALGTLRKVDVTGIPAWAKPILPPPAPVLWTHDLMAGVRGCWRPQDLTSSAEGALIAALPSYGGVITNTLTQTDDTLKPAVGIYNTKKTALFDGANDFMYGGDNTITNGADAMYAYALLKFVTIAADSNYKFIMFEEGTGAGRRWGILLGNTPSNKKIGITYRIPDNAASTTRLSGTTMLTDSAHFLCVEMIISGSGGPRQRIWLDDTVILDEVPGVEGVPAYGASTFNAADSPRSGYGGQNNSLIAQCNAHFILWGQGRGRLSDSDRQKAAGAALHYVGLQAQLPNGHPYKDNPPYL